MKGKHSKSLFIKVSGPLDSSFILYYKSITTATAEDLKSDQ